MNKPPCHSIVGRSEPELLQIITLLGCEGCHVLRDILATNRGHKVRIPSIQGIDSGELREGNSGFPLSVRCANDQDRPSGEICYCGEKIYFKLLPNHETSLNTARR